MFCPECGNHAANKALRMLGIQDNTHSIKWAYTENTDGLVTSSNGIHVKVSGLTPSIEELEGGIVSAVYDGDVATVTLTNGTTLIGLDGMTFATEVMLVVYRDNYSNEELVPGVVFPEKGIYMANNEGMTIELSYGSIHPIDQKYIPGPVVIDVGLYEDEHGNRVEDYLLQILWGDGETCVNPDPEYGDYDSEEVVELVKKLVADVPADKPFILYMPLVGYYIHNASVATDRNGKNTQLSFSFTTQYGKLPDAIVKWATVVITSDGFTIGYSQKMATFTKYEE